MGIFRGYIEDNKRHVLAFLKGKEPQSSYEVMTGYHGEKTIYAVRTALNELNNEGKVVFEKRYLNSKYWKLK
ncbi:MAG: hypothetical protein EGR83_07945 [Bacteroides cellulosilyticus]|nr:hypothetical protein [Bacteroides cellulosilyticus]